MIKILIGGSPCTFWSIAQKNNREVEAEGLGWELFRNYLIAKEKFKPDLFLYENNKSAAQPIKDQISRELGVELMHINSALVSAQNRWRFYAFNWDVEQPEDRGILLKDIIETGEAFLDKSYALTTRCCGAIPEDTLKRHRHTMIAEPVIFQRPRGNNDGGIKYDKAPTLTANGAWAQNNKVVEPVCPIPSGKARCLTAGYAHKGGKHILESNFSENPNKQTWDSVAESVPFYAIPCEWDENETPTKAKREADGKIYTVYEVKDGLIEINGKEYPIKLPDGFYIIRKLTPTECERLQTLPDGYTAAVSDTQRYKGLGNGWTAEVIIHILNGALKDVPRDEEIVVLSMYDGIGTGRYCLDKMGFTNVTYYAYEIDEPAMKVALSHYPDIIQLGDAFDLRRDDWELGKRYEKAATETAEDPAEDPEENQEDEDEDLDSEAGADPSKTTGTAGETTPPDREESLRGSEDPGGVQDLAGNKEGPRDCEGIGERLRNLRRKAKLKQQELADRLQIACSTYRLYEGEERLPPAEVIVRICRLFSVSSDYLLGIQLNKAAPIEKYEAADSFLQLFDEFFRRSIIAKFTATIKNAGITPEPEFLERLNGATLKELGNIAVAFPAYIVAATLENGSNENKNT